MDSGFILAKEYRISISFLGVPQTYIGYATIERKHTDISYRCQHWSDGIPREDARRREYATGGWGILFIYLLPCTSVLESTEWKTRFLSTDQVLIRRLINVPYTAPTDFVIQQTVTSCKHTESDRISSGCPSHDTIYTKTMITYRLTTLPDSNHQTPTGPTILPRQSFGGEALGLASSRSHMVASVPDINPIEANWNDEFWGG